MSAERIAHQTNIKRRSEKPQTSIAQTNSMKHMELLFFWNPWNFFEIFRLLIAGKYMLKASIGMKHKSRSVSNINQKVIFDSDPNNQDSTYYHQDYTLGKISWQMLMQ